ncbi:Hint domain-containing protein [Primorskyibacter sp. S187A]|uniref:Hint domain-containing protein n=1 Tax=Primorskyibacter sp. S187A TaxID=3415130 RepID=UPI003C7BE2E2
MRRPVQSIPAYVAEDLRVVGGANLGDPIGVAEDIQPDDIYHLAPDAARVTIALSSHEDGSFEVAQGTTAGTPGHKLHLDCCVTLMAPDGGTVECIILVEVDADGMIDAVYALPLHQLAPRCDYRIIGLNRDEARTKFAHVGCVSFTRGTRITMATGAQCPIEDLRPGDRVLTRDAGPQEVRWIGQSTMKAAGAFAPILIRAGTLNNLGDLLVSPDHRLFIYQREDTLGAGRSEVMVRAQHLLNGTSVTRRTGGYVDYFQLLFDEHQIIYAEGIAAESLLVDSQTRPVLPEDIASSLASTTAGRDTGLRSDFEVSERLAKRPDAAELLRRASTR